MQAIIIKLSSLNLYKIVSNRITDKQPKKIFLSQTYMYSLKRFF